MEKYNNLIKEENLRKKNKERRIQESTEKDDKREESNADSWAF